MSQTGWTAKASMVAQKHAGQLMMYGYHLKDANTTQRAEALMRALRVYGPKNMDLKMGFLEGVNVNNPVLHRRAKLDAQYVKWLSGKNVPLPSGYPRLKKIGGRGKFPTEGYHGIIYRQKASSPYEVRVFTKDYHHLLTKKFANGASAAQYKRRIEER